LRLPNKNPSGLKDPKGLGTPVVVNIHGGFWRAAYDLTHAGHLCQAITDLGFATWNIEYRRIGNGGGYPDTFVDVVNAINHLRIVAPQYNLDLDRVIVMGHSAGGHLASWVGSTRSAETLHATSLQVKPTSIISLAGVVDLRRALELGLSNNVVKDFLGGAPEEFPDRYAASSPIELLPCGTKQILIHGEQDDIVPIEIAQRYYDAAKAKGDDAKLIPLKGMGHFEVIDPKSAAWETVRETIQSIYQ
jgi:acetyl esterase/lipase